MDAPRRGFKKIGKQAGHAHPIKATLIINPVVP
jgi:hypothetical protein